MLALLLASCGHGQAPALDARQRGQQAPAPPAHVAGADASSTRSDSQGLARAALATPEAPASGVSAAWLAGLEKDRPYATFRDRALANGWTPLTSADCMANVVGANYERLCATPDAPATCATCAELPELNACSGDGYCEMQFVHAGARRILQVDTYGAIDRGARQDSGPRVIGWRVADVSAR